MRPSVARSSATSPRSARTPTAPRAEERLLVLAAESLERDDSARQVRALEDFTVVKPRSWRAHYILAKLRAEGGHINEAIVALRARACRPPAPRCRDRACWPSCTRTPAPRARIRAPAPDRVRRAMRTVAAQELTAIIALQRGDLDAGRAAFERAVAAGAAGWELHASYAAALHARGESAEAIPHYEAAVVARGPSIVRLNLARAVYETGNKERAGLELDTLLKIEKSGEIAGAGAPATVRHPPRPDLEAALETAGQGAVEGDATRFAAARAGVRCRARRGARPLGGALRPRSPRAPPG